MFQNFIFLDMGPLYRCGQAGTAFAGKHCRAGPLPRRPKGASPFGIPARGDTPLGPSDIRNGGREARKRFRRFCYAKLQSAAWINGGRRSLNWRISLSTAVRADQMKALYLYQFLTKAAVNKKANGSAN